MPNYLVVAADAARARIFSRAKKFSPLAEDTVLTHPESRLRRQDLVTDRPGTIHESKTPGESDADPVTDPKRAESETFAREISRHLQSLRTQGKVEGITLVADPRFLGQLRAAMDHETAKLIIHELGANLTRESADDIQQRIDA